MRFNRMPWMVLVAAVATFAYGTAVADGPHWHVPNPDGDEDFTFDPEQGGNDSGKKVANPVVAGGDGGGGKAGLGDWDKNPGNFLEMDQKCIEWYEKHCVIKFSQNKGKEDFYIKIMNRCAQAMREVDEYCPCPDSYPLWHTEELRQLMIGFSKLTWQRSTQLDRKTAEACAEFIVQCFVDTVRFGDNRRRKAFAGDAKAFVELNDKLVAALRKAAQENDPKAQKALLDEWRQLHAGSAFVKIPKDLTDALTTFAMITGDIPVQVDEAEMRMMDGLANMGLIVVKYLNKYTKDKNPDVVRSVYTVLGYIQKKMTTPQMVAPNMSNILTQLRYLKVMPNAPEGQLAVKQLKLMGDRALPTLVRIYDNENLGLKDYALAAMGMASDKGFGRNIEKWRAYAKEIEEKEKTARPKEEPQPNAGQGAAPAEEKKEVEKNALLGGDGGAAPANPPPEKKAPGVVPEE